MEDRLPDHATADQWSEQFARMLGERRDRARLLLQTERDRILRIETSLTEQIQQVDEQLDHHRRDLARRDEELEWRAAELAEQAEQLARRREELEEHRRRWEAEQAEAGACQETLLSDLQQRTGGLDARRDELARQEREFSARQHELEHREQEFQERAAAWDAERESVRQLRESLDQDRLVLDQTARQLEAGQRQLHEEAAALAARQADQADREEQLEQLHTQLKTREQETRDQRRQIAQHLRTQRAEQRAEFERRQAELVKLAANEDLQLAPQLAEATARVHQLQHTLDQSREETRQRDANARELHDQCSQLREQLDHQQAAATREREDWQRELITWQQRVEQLERDASSSAEEPEIAALRQQVADATDEVQRLTMELTRARTTVDEQDSAAREALSIAHAKIEELEELRLRQEQEIAELRRQEDAPPTTDRDLDELQERHELLMQDLREMKAENRRLAEQLAQARKTSAAHPGPALGFDWEAQKRRLLAELEENADEQDSERVQERLTIEGAIEITDQVVAAKDQEIAELRGMLEQQAGHIGNLTIGAAAIAEMLDQDQLIQEERENLARLQNEWREKLRKAEMEMAVERACLARERAVLEEQARVSEQPPARQAPPRRSATPPTETEKPPRRWLARLGLRDE